MTKSKEGHRNDMGIGPRIVTEKSRMRPVDIHELRANTTRAKFLIDWKPTVDIREGLRRTIEWFNSHGKKWSWEDRFPELWK